MSLDLFISETNEIETNFVCRNFNLGDRVNIYFKDKFYSGKVVNKRLRENIFGKQPYLLVKTDEKVDEEDDALLEGYGIRGWAEGKVYFEDESLPDGDEIYKKSVRRAATPEEIAEHSKPLPF